MSAAANDITKEGVKALYQEVIEKLIASSLVELPCNRLPKKIYEEDGNLKYERIEKVSHEKP
jgi:hypothetical protein